MHTALSIYPLRSHHMACVPDRDSAMREVAQAYELIKSHQPRLQFDDVQQLSATTNLAQSLLNNAMRALHLALCVMNPQTSAHCGAESSSRSNRPHLFSPSAAAGDVGGITSQQKKGKRRRYLLSFFPSFHTFLIHPLIFGQVY